MITHDDNGHWSNRTEDVVMIESHNPQWADQFADEQHSIRNCVDASIPLVIEHFGSTAIPGLPAKPIIDILIGAERRHWAAIIQALKAIEYLHWDSNPEPDRKFLVKGMPPFGVRRTHHVHLCEVGGRLWERLLFRDYLRYNREDRAAYADLKNRLAAEHRDDREAYTRGKDALIAEVMDRARAWRRA